VTDLPAPSALYLTGFMGCGKSTLGPIAANVLGYDFADLDEAIAERAGRSIAEIFASRGEAHFRALEAQALRTVGRDTPTVVALGGGAFVQPENAHWLLRRGTVAYLYLPTEALVQRLIRSPTPRPLLFGPDGTKLSEPQLRQRVRELVAQRDPLYRRAHLTVEVASLPIGHAVDRLVGAFRAYRRTVAV
jgi:shikimate kinase